MARFFDFAVVRLAPQGSRGESLNIGVIVFDKDRLDVRASARLQKVRALSTAVDVDELQQVIDNLANVDEKARDAGMNTVEDRASFLRTLGPITLSPVGQFIAPDSNIYEQRIASIFKAMVTPEQGARQASHKRSKLLTQMKKALRQQRVMAQKEEDLNAHRVVSSYILEEGLVADLILKNGKFHVIETVDVSGEDDTIRKAIADIGVSALVLERARMKFGPTHTKSSIVYSASSALERAVAPSLEAARHQGADLVNWASRDDQRAVINNLASLAIPIPSRKRHKTVSFRAAVAT